MFGTERETDLEGFHCITYNKVVVAYITLQTHYSKSHISLLVANS